MYRSVTTHGEKPKRQNFWVWTSHEEHRHTTTAIQDVAFSAIQFCSYTICHASYDQPFFKNSYTSCFRPL